MEQNLLVNSWEELKTCFSNNKLKNNRAIKIGLLFNAQLSQKEMLIELTKRDLDPVVMKDLIQIKVPLTEIEKGSSDVHYKKVYEFIPKDPVAAKLRKKELRNKKQKLIQKRKNSLVFNYYMAYIHFLDSHRMIFVSTNETSKIQSKLINPLINNIKGISLLWLSYQLMAKMLTFLKDKVKNYQINQISAEYKNTFQKKAIIRPNCNKKVKFSDPDAEAMYDENKYQYGLYPRKIDIALTDYGRIVIRKTYSNISFTMFDPDFLEYTLIPWIYDYAETYLLRILDFKIQEVVDPITQIKNFISNYLVFEYNSEETLILEDIINEIRENKAYNILSMVGGKKEYNLIIGEKKSHSVMNVFLNPQNLYFTLNHGESFDSIFPLLNLFDNHGKLVLVNDN